jgi:hypothetical protein
MQSQVVIAALEGIAAKAVVVQSRAAGDQDPILILLNVVKTLEVISPFPILVQLVEYQQRLLRKLHFQNLFAVLGKVPVEVAAFPVQNPLGKCGLGSFRLRVIWRLVKIGRE